MSVMAAPRDIERPKKISHDEPVVEEGDLIFYRDLATKEKKSAAFGEGWRDAPQASTGDHSPLWRAVKYQPVGVIVEYTSGTGKTFNIEILEIHKH